MEVGQVLEAARKKRKTTETNFELPPFLDLALLSVQNNNVLDEEAYKADREDYLRASARASVQLLMNTIFNRPTLVRDDGVMASLPVESTFVLPREKALPKPKPPTKWERFAAQKGITSKSKKDRMTFDEEKQEWVPKWGYKKDQLDKQWLVEVPSGKPADFDPRAAEREDRKKRKLKNETDRMRNDLPSIKTRKLAIERGLESTRKSNTSLGRVPTGPSATKQGPSRGRKRQLEANEMGANVERERSMKMIKTLASGKKGNQDDLVNARKAIRQVNGAHPPPPRTSKGKRRR